MNKRVTVCRKEHFNAAHRLHSPALSEQRNAELFGKCNYPNYHGHNYDLVVRVTGEVDPVTGYVIDMKELSELVKHNVIEKFDHKNLNLDTKEFSDLNPTAENIAMVVYEILREKVDKRYELKITLYETERNYVEFPA